MRLARLASLGLVVAAALVAPLLLRASAQDEPERGARAKAKGRVLLISIDALRPEAYRDDRYDMPNLRKLGARGVQAKHVVGIFPTLTYPSHTTIATGTRSARHGIFSNTIFDPKDGGKRWFFEATHIRSTTLWDAAHKGGLKTAAVRWPVTVGATIDWNLTEIFDKEKTNDPWDIMRRTSTPGLFDELWPAVKGRGEPALDESIAASSAAIIEKHKPELMMIHLLQADGAQHHNGRDHEEVVAAYNRLDGHLGTIFRALEVAGVASSTNIIVTGDHGMLDVHTAVKPNALLKEAGLLSVDEKGRFTEWSACSGTGGASAAVYVRDPSDKALVEKVVSLFKSAAASRYKGMFNVLDREALDREEAFPGAVCALEGEPGYTMETGATGGVLGVAHVKGNHGYHPSREEVQTGLVMAGPGIARGRVITQFRQLDIAPLAAHLMGIEMGPGVEGVLVPGVLAPVGKERLDDH